MAVQNIKHVTCYKYVVLSEKTRTMLFAGARRSNDGGSSQLKETSRVDQPHPLPGQLRLSASGKLCSSDEQAMDVQGQQDAPFGEVKVIEGFFNNNNYQMAALPQGQRRIDPTGRLTVEMKSR